MPSHLQNGSQKLTDTAHYDWSERKQSKFYWLYDNLVISKTHLHITTVALLL